MSGFVGLPIAEMRAETMRALCRDLGAGWLSSGRVQDLRPFLEDAQRRGGARPCAPRAPHCTHAHTRSRRRARRARARARRL
jgi:hypothetical protein